MLHQCAGHFFNRVHSALLFGTSSALGRLLDPPNHGRDRPNYSLESLFAVLPPELPRESLARLLQEARVIEEPIRQFRNKRVGHFDLDVAEGRIELAGFPIETVDACMRKLADFFNLVLGQQRPSSSFDGPGYAVGDSECLVSALIDSKVLKVLTTQGRIGYQELQDLRSSMQGKSDQA